MRFLAKIMLVSVAAFAAADTAFAQANFTTTPLDTIETSIPLEGSKLLTFQMRATNSTTLNLSWEQLYVSIPAQWEVTLCDYGTCYPDLPSSGSMYPLPAGDYGQMILDVKPHAHAGTAFVRYAIWDAGNPGAKDTLTWIVHSNPTAISTTNKERAYAFAVGKTLFIKAAFQNGQMISVYDLAGRRVFQKGISIPDDAIDLSSLNNGIYVLVISSNGNYASQKISLGLGQ